MERQTRAHLYAAAAILLWSTVAAAFKITLGEMDVVRMLCTASFVSMTALFILLLIQRKWRLLAGCTGREVLRSSLFGFLNPFAYYLILFSAYDRLPAQVAQPLNYTWPIMLAILSVFILRQRIGLRGAGAIAISFCGILVISTQGDPLSLRFADPVGAALALGSSVVWALFWLLSVRDRRDETVKLFLNFAAGFLFSAALLLFSQERGMPPLRGLLAAAYVGLFEMGITFVLWMKALSLSRSAAKIGQLAYIAPFLSLIFIQRVGGETILPSSIAGLALIVAGVLLHGRVLPHGQSADTPPPDARKA